MKYYSTLAFFFFSFLTLSGQNISLDTTRQEVSSYRKIGLIRPNVSIGYLSANDVKGLTYNYGLKVLLTANEIQRYGIILDHLKISNNDQLSYLRTGIFIEQVLFQHFNMGIGTIGYINLVQKGENPFGLYTHLGYEYKITRHINIVVSYQSDFVFRKHFTMYNAFLVGLGMQF